MDISETSAASGLKIGRYKQLILDPRPGRCVCFLEQETFTPQKYW